MTWLKSFLIWLLLPSPRMVVVEIRVDENPANGPTPLEIGVVAEVDFIPVSLARLLGAQVRRESFYGRVSPSWVLRQSNGRGVLNEYGYYRLFKELFSGQAEIWRRTIATQPNQDFGRPQDTVQP